MTQLSLRLRVFLFFGLLAAGGFAALCGGLYAGYHQLGDDTALSAFVSAGAIGGMGLTGLAVLIWLLFDENVCKPIESLAAGVRVQAHGTGQEDIETEAAKYLGDLAPAVTAIHRRLNMEARASSEAGKERTAQLEAQSTQLLQILSDIPVAVMLARADHQIVLYDGQAAELMERECPARLDGSVFDYLEAPPVLRALETLKQQNKQRLDIAVTGHSGAVYKGHIRRFGSTEGYTLMLEPLTPDASRPLVYDFDLLEKSSQPEGGDRALRDLAFVVFDSETTGLDPKNDEVVQLAAVRVVNGRVVEGETFDTLVNPFRPIPKRASDVHGITDSHVAEAPSFDTVTENFHGFCKGSIIIAHNAPFDMAFLRRQCARLPLAFDHPILDTVHLSAVVFGGSAEHTLDALCQRLNVPVSDIDRHTALGDARATAEAFVAMIPILEARGLNTLGDLRAEAQKHNRILTVDA